ncbi:MAG TPA: CobQ/CobB/MinD/ParA nucleotide binding domain-containing protein [Anaerolineae bacterium]|nr:CobQ/CobB/MinD/ParA nucleotide binding domain-containing protein [Anaerolineae bacterium]
MMPYTGPPLRILLISSHEECRDTLQQALAEAMTGQFQLFWVSLPEVAEKRARELLPRIIFIDDALIGYSASRIVRRLRQQVPKAAYIIVVNPSNTREAQRAILEGARAFLLKPVDSQELVETLEQILASADVDEEPGTERTPHKRKGKAIVFAAPKGGTGHTTLAINTAICMYRQTKEPVALVDADFFSPAVDLALNLHAQYTIQDVLPRVSHLDHDIVSTILASHTSGIHALLAPPPRLSHYSIPVPQIQEIVAGLKEFFAWEFIDLQSFLDETAIAFLDSADSIILTVLPELTNLRNVRLMLDVFAQRGYSKGKIRLVLNRWDMRGAIPAKEIEKYLHMEIAFRIPDDQPLATYSNNRGIPLVVSHPKSALGKAFRDFVLYLKEQCARIQENPDETMAQKPSFLTFWRE